MSSNKDDFHKIIERSNKILIFPPEKNTTDQIAASFSLYHLFKKMSKEVTLFLKQPLPEKLSFLKKPDKIIDDLSGSRDFVIIFNTKKNKIVDIKTRKEDGQYRIIVTPEKGSIDPRDFSFVPAQFKYDLIITLGIESLEKLGASYYDNTDLFFEVPKINIDNHGTNDNYGQINLVDSTASSPAEIIAELALEKYENLMDEDIAQSLLTGIISATESFQRPISTPTAMITAAKLMKYKADQPTIIRYLYKTKSLSFLKLWGRVMARLNWDKQAAFIWSLISEEDFIQSRADKNDIPFILEEIQKNFSDGRAYAIIYTGEKTGTNARIKFDNEKTALALAEIYDLPTSKDMLIKFPGKNLLEAEKDLLEKLKAG